MNNLKNWLILAWVFVGFNALAISAPSITSCARTSSTSVSLSWTSVSGASYYVVKRSYTSSSSSASTLGTPTGTSYTDSSAGVDTCYYWVEAWDSSGAHAISGMATASSGGGSGGGGGSSGGFSISASKGTSTEGVVITWSSQSGATGYRVVRGNSSDMNYASILVETVTGTSYTDTTAVSGKTYYYWIVAKKSSGYVTSSYATGYCGDPSSGGGGSSTEGVWRQYPENPSLSQYKTYCVIDISAGKDASSYPVIYMDSPPSGGFNTDEYKTTKIVLRKIPAGLIKYRHPVYYNVEKIDMAVPYYCGIYEVTQKQYKLVTGSNPSSSQGDTKPLNDVTWNAFRGSTSSSDDHPSTGEYDFPRVDPNTFVGRLQARTGLNVDLPSYPKWIYAYRAGTSSIFYWGNSVDGSYCWYASNSGGEIHSVGTRKPNAWGLYDMSGNVWEWTITRYSELYKYRVVCGGCSASTSEWSEYTGCSLMPDYFFQMNQTQSTDGWGFRLAIVLPRMPFSSDDLEVSDYSGMYDGASHGIRVSVSAGVSGAKVGTTANCRRTGPYSPVRLQSQQF